MKKSDYHVNKQPPVSIKDMPYTLDIRALLSYAKAKGTAISLLSEDEKQRFLIPNSQYQASIN